MTKRQLFLIAGTMVLAACGRNPTEYCVQNEDTQEAFCPGRQNADPQAPATSIDTGEPQ